MNDWITNALICVAMLCAVVALMMFGMEAEQNAWQKDCAALGKHRSEGIIYACKVEGKAP